MARKSGQSASPTARPRPAKQFGVSVLNVPGKKGGPQKSNTLVNGKSAGTGHK
jgi:hypothetical protein